MAEPTAPDVSSRRHQMFPVLTDAEIERMRRFGDQQAYATGTRLITAGEPSPGMFVVVQGVLDISQRDGLGHVVPVTKLERGQFSGEVAQLSGRPALVDGHAEGDLEVILIPPAQLRALIIAEADLGERIVRALILRRVGLIQSGGGGPVLIGAPQSPDILRLQNFLTRNGHPYHTVDADDVAAVTLREQYSASSDDVLAVCPN